MANATLNQLNYKGTLYDIEDSEARNGLATKADANSVYTKNEVDTALSNKADKSATYTKEEVDTALDGKADTSDIPTVPIIAIQKNGAGITPVSGTVNITVPTTAADVSALPDTTKYAAALSLTINSSTFVMTGQLKDQNGDNLGTAQTIDLPLESVVVNGSYNSQTKKVVLTLQNGNTIEFSVADLVAGLQTELSASNKLNPAYINYDSTHRAVSDTEKSTWNSKQNAIDSSHKLSADLVDDTSTTNKFATAAELEQIETNKNNILLKQDKTWIQLKRVTTTSDTFELDLHGKSEFKIVLIHNTDIYEASAPVDLIAAGYKLIVSHVNSATPSTDIGTFVYNFSAQGTDDFTATIPSTSYNLLIFAR